MVEMDGLTEEQRKLVRAQLGEGACLWAVQSQKMRGHQLLREPIHLALWLAKLLFFGTILLVFACYVLADMWRWPSDVVRGGLVIASALLLGSALYALSYPWRACRQAARHLYAASAKQLLICLAPEVRLVARWEKAEPPVLHMLPMAQLRVKLEGLSASGSGYISTGRKNADLSAVPDALRVASFLRLLSAGRVVEAREALRGAAASPKLSLPVGPAALLPWQEKMLPQLLASDENVLWAGKPRGILFDAASSGAFRFGILLSLFMALFTVVCAYLQRDEPFLWMLIPASPFWVGAIVLLVAPWWRRWRKASWLYVLSSQRALILRPSLGGGYEIEAYPLEAGLVKDVEFYPAHEGLGDVVFVRRRETGAGALYAHGFLEVENAAEVAQHIELAINAITPTRI